MIRFMLKITLWLYGKLLGGQGQSGNEEVNQEAFGGIEILDDGCLDQDSGSGDKEKKMDLSYILKIESTAFDDWVTTHAWREDPVSGRGEEGSGVRQTQIQALASPHIC